jgi:hypothetical protein
MLDSRISSDRLISFAAPVEIPNMSRREGQAWRIASVVAVAAGLVIALLIALAMAGALAARKAAWVAFRGRRTGCPSVAFCLSIFPPASAVPMTHSQERIWSIISIAAIGLGLVLALALAHS